MKVYLCGGINGLSDDDAKVWREAAKAELSRHEIECIDPMRRDYRGIEDEAVTAIVMGDIADIKASDLILAMCTKPSWGTAMEIEYAHGIHVPVFSIVGSGPVSPWLRFFTNAHRSLDEAIASAVAFKSWLNR